jgi:hypothetical protein
MLLTSVMLDRALQWQHPTSGVAYPLAGSVQPSVEPLGDRYARIFAAAGVAGSSIPDRNAILSGQAMLVGPDNLDARSSVIPDWPVRPHWRDNLRADIAGYANRTHGWDGFQAKPIDAVAISDALHFVDMLPDELPPPHDQPCSDGEVSLVWRIGACFAEVSFPGDHTFYWYCTNGSEEDAGEGISVDMDIPGAVSRIMGFDVDHAPPARTSHAPVGYRELRLAA